MDETGSRNDDLNGRMGPIVDMIHQQVAEEVGKAFQINIPNFLEEMRTTLTNFIQEKFQEFKVNGEKNDEEKVDKEKRKCSYKDFMACKPLEFNGEIDPLISQRWITDMEGIFKRSHCDSSDEVIFATGQLRDRAKDWWENFEQGSDKETIKNMTWEDFKRIFLKHYCPQSAIDRIHEEFLHLRQKNESIDAITGIFFDKAKFCPELVRTERMKINRYHDMLKAEFREFITPSKCETLQELIDWARAREMELQKQVERGEKRHIEKSFSPAKKIKYSESPRKTNSKVEISRCKTCGRNHPGECRFKQLMCYNCGQTGHGFSDCTSPVSLCFRCYKPGHKKSDCPELKKGNASGGQRMEIPKPRGRAFQITTEEAKVTPEVVTGNQRVGTIKQKSKNPQDKGNAHV